MSNGKYDVIIDTMPATESRLEILFRQAGDGFLQVEYGREQRAALQDSFRMLAINDIILSKEINGLIETVPGPSPAYARICCISIPKLSALKQSSSW
jgi:hypothetical protein